MASQTELEQKVVSAADETPYPSSGYAWYVVGVLTLVYIFSFVDRQILNLLVRPIRRDLGISDTQMSLLMGFSFALFYTFFGIPLGRAYTFSTEPRPPQRADRSQRLSLFRWAKTHNPCSHRSRERFEIPRLSRLSR